MIQTTAVKQGSSSHKSRTCNLSVSVMYFAMSSIGCPLLPSTRTPPSEKSYGFVTLRNDVHCDARGNCTNNDMSQSVVSLEPYVTHQTGHKGLLGHHVVCGVLGSGHEINRHRLRNTSKELVRLRHRGRIGLCESEGQLHAQR